VCFVNCKQPNSIIMGFDSSLLKIKSDLEQKQYNHILVNSLKNLITVHCFYTNE